MTNVCKIKWWCNFDLLDMVVKTKSMKDNLQKHGRKSVKCCGIIRAKHAGSNFNDFLKHWRWRLAETELHRLDFSLLTMVIFPRRLPRNDFQYLGPPSPFKLNLVGRDKVPIHRCYRFAIRLAQSSGDINLTRSDGRTAYERESMSTTTFNLPTRSVFNAVNIFRDLDRPSL